MNAAPASAPGRLTVPTRIGCGATGRFGTCDAGCSEHNLELVRAAIYDSLVAIESSARIRADAFRAVAEALAWRQPAAEAWEAAYTAVQDDARRALRRHPDGDGRTVDCEKPPELARNRWLRRVRRG